MRYADADGCLFTPSNVMLLITLLVKLAARARLAQLNEIPKKSI